MGVRALRNAGLRCLEHGLLRLSPRGMERYARLTWCLRALFDSRARWSGWLRHEWGRTTLGLGRETLWRTLAAERFEHLLDRRLLLERLHGRHTRWPGLEEAAQALHDRLERLRRETPGQPVILSPFHYVSQYANICLMDLLRARLGLDELAVVSGVPREDYGHQEQALTPGLRILHTYDEGNRNALGLKFLQALRRDGFAVLFADVPPYLMQRYPMETVAVSILGRPARIHHGVFRIGARLDALLLPFHLSFANGCFGYTLFEPIRLARDDAPQRLADCIELASRSAYPDWIIAGHPSQYGFAPSK